MDANLLMFPRRGQWITLMLSDGRTRTCRFVGAGRSRCDNVYRWEVDHGRHGSSRHDVFIPMAAITGWTPAPRPPLRLSYVSPLGKRCFVGRFLTPGEAQAAIDPVRPFVHDIRIEAVS